MASHFHNEFVMKVVLAGKPVPDTPSFVKVFKNTGVDIVHLGEFHYTAHPKGPDDKAIERITSPCFSNVSVFLMINFYYFLVKNPMNFLVGIGCSFFQNLFTGSCREKKISPLFRKILYMEPFIVLPMRKKCLSC